MSASEALIRNIVSTLFCTVEEPVDGLVKNAQDTKNMECFDVFENEENILQVTPPVNCLVGLALTIWGGSDYPIVYRIGADWEDAEGVDKSITWLERSLPFNARLQIRHGNSAQKVWPDGNPDRPQPSMLVKTDLIAKVSIGSERKQSFVLNKNLASHFIVTLGTSSADSDASHISFFGRESTQDKIVYYLDEPLGNWEKIEIVLNESPDK